MGSAIGQTLSFAVGVAISPVPIIAVILVLVSGRARANGPAFLVGWLVGLGVVGTVVLLLAGRAEASDGGEPATWVGVLKLVLGALLLLLALKQWRGRPHDGEAAPAARRRRRSRDRPDGDPGRRAGARLCRLRARRHGRSRDPRRHLLRPRRARGRPARRAQALDGPEQRGDHDRPLPRPRREAPRRRDLGPRLTVEVAPA